MAHDRTAIDTIRGYYYQFDYYILKLLEAAHDSDIVCIEGIEDVDIFTNDETVAIQCKYYSGTEYNHSVLAKPIRLMLKDYADRLKNGEFLVKYAIYGHYSSGQNKLPFPLDIQFFIKNIFTYKENKNTNELHNILELNDENLIGFIQNLMININAPSYEEQEKQIRLKLKQSFSCTVEHEVDYYYNNALCEIKKLSTQKHKNKRNISKKDFISSIDNANDLFNIWYMKKKGLENYCKTIRKRFFTLKNISPYERFFMIECDASISSIELKILLQNISKKWSKLSNRSEDTFCPYIYLHGISNDKLIEIKKQLWSDDFHFSDGYDFKGSDFSVLSICGKATFKNIIKLKIIETIGQVNDILAHLSKTREIYQFYKNELFYKQANHKHIKIPIFEINDINNII